MNPLELLPVIYYAFVHTLTPGHSKTLLVAGALAGTRRSSLLLYATGFGLAHGAAMGVACGLGFAFKGVLLTVAGHHPELVLNVSVAVLAIAFVYFTWEAWRIHRRRIVEEADSVPQGWLERYPLLTGMAVGALPCPDVIGMGLVVPNLTIGMGQLVPTLVAVWLTVGVTIIALGAVLSLLPVRGSVHRMHLPEWFPAAASACVCLLVIGYRVGVT